MLEEIERLGLTSYRHSLACQFNPVNSIPVTDLKFGPETVNQMSIANGSFKNAETYHKLLRPKFQSTCISIITEPCFYEKEALITEKTFMAFMGGTIPIWFGGWKNATAMRNLGFDVFDDVINHSYDNIEDDRERISTAVKELDRLNDTDLYKLHANCKQRFVKNQQWLKGPEFVDQFLPLKI